MAFCGNVIELVEKSKILDDIVKFLKWTQIDGNIDIEVFIEESLLPELMNKDLVIIDAAIGIVQEEKFGMLFIKKDDDVYG